MTASWWGPLVWGTWQLAHPWVTLAGGLATIWLLLRERNLEGARWLHSMAGWLRVQVGGARTWRHVLAAIQPWLRLLAGLLLSVAAGRPQVQQEQDQRVEGIDLFVAFDMSGSMYAVDLSPAELQQWLESRGSDPPNRFEYAVDVLKDFVRSRQRDRIGMVVFAREAFLQFPLTLDYDTILQRLEALRLEQIDPGATAIGNALGLSLRGLMGSDATTRTIILITDGKQQGGNVSPVQAASLAAEEGIRIFTILVGREGPGLIPTGLRTRSGQMQYRQQEIPVDPALLEQISAMTGGQAYRSENREELERDLGAILDTLETSVLQSIAHARPLDRFAGWAFLALVLLLVEGLLSGWLVRRYP
jgi:Ca-activated chloride channel family protein